MNVVDVAIIVVIGLAIAHGIAQGAAIQLLSFGGLWGGLLVGAALAPTVAGLSTGPFGKAFGSLLAFFGCAVIGGVIGRTIGNRAWLALHKVHLQKVDSALGAVIAVIATVAAVWLMALLLSAGPTRAISAAINQSAIVKTLTRKLPDQPQVFSQLRHLIDTSRFPQVFEGLEPEPPKPIALPDDPAIKAADSAAAASTVKVFGPACGGIQTGSGFVAGAGLVVTNAHVVAGIDNVTIEDRSGRHPATVVLFDPDLDLAVVRTTGLIGKPLPLSGSVQDRGAGAAFLGFPGGGPYRAQGAAVLQSFTATGRDIYGKDTTRRSVYQLQAAVREGNSGGPFVTTDGTVLGVIFAASTTDGNIGYALTSPQVIEKVNAARNAGRVDTGPCAA